MGFTLTKTTTTIMSRERAQNALTGLLSPLIGGAVLVGRAFPASVLGDERTTAAIDSRNHAFLVVVGQVGAIDANVNIKISVAAVAGGPYASYHSFDTLEDADDNKEVLGIIDCRKIPAETPWVKGVMTIGAGTTGNTSMAIIGIGIGASGVEPEDIASVDEVYSEIEPPPYVAGFLTGSPPTGPVANISELTPAVCTGGATGVEVEWSAVVTATAARYLLHANLDFTATTTPTEEVLTGAAVWVQETGEIIALSAISPTANISAIGDSVHCELILGMDVIQ